jgi:predicted transposase/invertase (TIGR01784 family)
MEGLVDRAGKFRNGGVRVVQGTRVLLRYIFRRSDTTAREALALNLHPEMREQVMTMEEEAIQRGVEKGLQEGLRQKALEDARRMRDHGIAWDIVTDVTGIVPAELG